MPRFSLIVVAALLLVCIVGVVDFAKSAKSTDDDITSKTGPSPQKSYDIELTPEEQAKVKALLEDPRTGDAAGKLLGMMAYQKLDQRYEWSKRKTLQDQWDVLYYDLDLKINFELLYAWINGIAKTRLKSLVNGLSKVELNLYDYGGDCNPLLSGWICVDSVLVDGNRVPPDSVDHSDDLLTILLKDPLDNGDTCNVAVYYRCRPAPIAVHFGSVSTKFGFVFENQFISLKRIVYNISEPFFARSWWPCKDTPSDKADSIRIRLTYPEEFKAAVVGSPGPLAINGDGTVSRTWRHNHHIATYLIGLGVTDYNVIDTTLGEIPIKFYYYDSTQIADDVERLMQQVPKMMDCLSNNFGMAYPFEKYDMHVIEGYVSMENQTNVSIGRNNFFPPGKALEYVTIHELIHQWFGDYVTCQSWPNIWLNEGFACYGVALWFESPVRDSGLFATMESWRDEALAASQSIYVIDSGNAETILDWDTQYNKGPWVVHMLRRLVGENNFFSTLNAYLTQYAESTATIDDFHSVCSSVCGPDVADSVLDYFFDEWIHGIGHPSYAYAYHYLGNHELALMIKQTQNYSADPWRPEVYHMPLDFIVDKGPQERTIRVFSGQRVRDTVVNVPFDAPPDSVRISLNWLLADTSHVIDCWLVTEKLKSAKVGREFDDTIRFACDAFASFTVWSGELPPGLALDNVTGRIHGVPSTTGDYNFTVKASEAEGLFCFNTYSILSFLCGDANGDGSVDISDAVYLIAYIFSGGLAPNPLLSGDANCDGTVDISDVVYLIAYIFSGGPAPCEGCK